MTEAELVLRICFLETTLERACVEIVELRKRIKKLEKEKIKENKK